MREIRGGALVYLLAGVGLIGAVFWSNHMGWASGATPAGKIEPNVRQSPGGWRSWTAWPIGLRGGK